MIHRYTARASALVMASLCAAPAFSQTTIQPAITPLTVIDGNNATKMTAALSYGGNLFPVQQLYGWSYGESLPAAVAVDPLTGALLVENGAGLAALGLLHSDLSQAGGLLISATALPLPSGAAQDQTLSNFASQAHTDASATRAVQGVVGGVPVPTSDSNDGAAGTGIAQPTGGGGFLGFLSGIYKAVTGTLSVAVTNFPATQAVSGSVSVSNMPATQIVSGSVSVSNLPSTQAVAPTAVPYAETTVTMTGTWVAVLAPLAARHGFTIADFASAGGIFWSGNCGNGATGGLIGTTTAGGIGIPQGASYESPVGAPPSTAICVFGPAGSKITVEAY